MATIDRRLEELEKRISPPKKCAFGFLDDTYAGDNPGMVKVQFPDGTFNLMAPADFERDYPGAPLVHFLDRSMAL